MPLGVSVKFGTRTGGRTGVGSLPAAWVSEVVVSVALLLVVGCLVDEDDGGTAGVCVCICVGDGAIGAE